MLDKGREVFDIEIEALRSVRDNLDDSFVQASLALLECRGKVIVTGLGKSGAIARKAAATFCSTGTPAIFLHATESVHGDLGVIAENDLVLAISYSGETSEISLIMPMVQRLGIKMIAITGSSNSSLAKNADIVLSVNIPQEACLLGLAPTSSTTATLALADALAVAVHEARGFTEEDFALRHPAGSLGRSLLRVSDLMHKEDELPVCLNTASLGEAIVEMTQKKLGNTTVVNEKGSLTSIVTDGDLRRLWPLKIDNILEQPLNNLPLSKSPKTISQDLLAVQALTIMEDMKITSLIIVDENNCPKGIIHIHDILRAKVI
ncbi:MAG: KpsF/GutQ family sugar-phosphate isomerase [Candidatus Lindowbacteria bacterium]|nr:KpsF/GutQ family sugar-phosphate isomerase [Candidatus Lindowbacteria bacterium]